MAEDENRGEERLKTAAMQSLNTHGGAWSNRQGTWPLSERRLIFASKKEIVSEQWMENLIKAVTEANYKAEEEDGGSNNINDLSSPINGTILNISQSHDESRLGGGL